jgi:hypothetical protein
MEGYNDQEQVPGDVPDDATSESDTGTLDSSSSSTDLLPRPAKCRRATVLGSEQYYQDMEEKYIAKGPTTIASAAHMSRGPFWDQLGPQVSPLDGTILGPPMHQLN